MLSLRSFQPVITGLDNSVRLFSLSRHILKAPPGIPEKASVLLPRSLIAIHGCDSAKFLNGLITTRPPESADGQPTPAQYAAMLNAKGRIIADMFIYPAHDVRSIQNELKTEKSCYLLEIDTKLVDKVLSVLEFHTLLSDVDINPLENFRVHALWNDTDRVNSEDLASNALWTEDLRAPGLGYRIIEHIPPFTEAAKEKGIIEGYEPASVDEYRLRRYLFGIPEGVEELPDGKSLPLDSCVDYMGGIDFNKGCYMGQELTIRTHHHGNVRKRIMPVVFTESPDEELPEDIYVPKEYDIEVGASISDETPVPNADAVAPIFGSSPFGSSKRAPESRKRPAGKVVAALGNIGLAQVRIDTLGHEFKLGDLYVKPMTPFWWPNSAEEPEN